MIKRLLTIAGALAVSMAAFSSCSNDPTLTNSSTTGSNINFQQLDREALPALKTVFMPYAQHDAYNRTQPTTDSTTMGAAITTTMTSFGRSTAVSSAAVALLTPDVLVADFSQSGDASLLGVQTAGLLNVNCTGARNGNGTFGGRSPFDDGGAAMLGIAYGNLTLDQTSPPADDGAEYTGAGGKPDLANDNVGCAAVRSRYTLTQFPYLPAPI